MASWGVCSAFASDPEIVEWLRRWVLLKDREITKCKRALAKTFSTLMEDDDMIGHVNEFNKHCEQLMGLVQHAYALFPEESLGFYPEPPRTWDSEETITFLVKGRDYRFILIDRHRGHRVAFIQVTPL